jgi:hypothetical protein
MDPAVAFEDALARIGFGPPEREAILTMSVKDMQTN